MRRSTGKQRQSRGDWLSGKHPDCVGVVVGRSSWPARLTFLQTCRSSKTRKRGRLSKRQRRGARRSLKILRNLRICLRMAPLLRALDNPQRRLSSLPMGKLTTRADVWWWPEGKAGRGVVLCGVVWVRCRSLRWRHPRRLGGCSLKRYRDRSEQAKRATPKKKKVSAPKPLYPIPAVAPHGYRGGRRPEREREANPETQVWVKAVPSAGGSGQRAPGECGHGTPIYSTGNARRAAPVRDLLVHCHTDGGEARQRRAVCTEYPVPCPRYWVPQTYSGLGYWGRARSRLCSCVLVVRRPGAFQVWGNNAMNTSCVIG